MLEISTTHQDAVIAMFIVGVLESWARGTIDSDTAERLTALPYYIDTYAKAGCDERLIEAVRELLLLEDVENVRGMESAELERLLSDVHELLRSVLLEYDCYKGVDRRTDMWSIRYRPCLRVRAGSRSRDLWRHALLRKSRACGGARVSYGSSRGG